VERRNPFVLQVAVLLFLAAGCRHHKKTAPSEDAGAAEQPEFVMSPFRIQAFGDSGLTWELRSPQAKAFTTMNVMRADQVDLTLYQNGQKSTSIQSEKGIFCIQNGMVADTRSGTAQAPADIHEGGITLQSGDMLLSGNVVVVSTDGTKLLTDWLHYQKLREVIVSTAPVKIIRADSITDGTGLEATPDLQRVKIYKQTLTIKGDDEKK
jgi:lipopolysaccharide export system protein LptC